MGKSKIKLDSGFHMPPPTGHKAGTTLGRTQQKLGRRLTAMPPDVIVAHSTEVLSIGAHPRSTTPAVSDPPFLGARKIG